MPFIPRSTTSSGALKFSRDESPDAKLDKLEALIVTHYGRPRADVRFVAAMLSIPCEDRYGALLSTVNILDGKEAVFDQVQ